MKFYRIHAETSSGKHYAMAGGYNPIPLMPFLDAMSEEFRKSRNNFWRINPGPPGLLIEPGTSKWPDCIWVGLNYPLECISNRVICDLEDAGIPIWRKTSMPIGEIKAKRLLKIPAPDYYVLEAEPGINVDFSPLGLPLNEKGFPLRGTYNSSKMGLPPVRLDTWNGEHLVSSRLHNPMYLLCTDVVKNLCEEKGWTNFEFKEVPVIP